MVQARVSQLARATLDAHATLDAPAPCVSIHHPQTMKALWNNSPAAVALYEGNISFAVADTLRVMLDDNTPLGLCDSQTSAV